MSPFIVHHLNGPLHYNVVATGFKSHADYNVDSTVTAFSASSTLILSHSIAYSCPVYETQKPLTLQDFVFTFTSHEESLITTEGEVLTRGNSTLPNPDFIAGLEQYMTTRSLQIPYTLTLHASNRLH